MARMKGDRGQKVLQRTLRSSSLEKLHQQLLPLRHLLLLHIIAINHNGKVCGGSHHPPPPQKTNSKKLCTSAAKLLPPKIQSGHHHPLLLQLL